MPTEGVSMNESKMAYKKQQERIFENTLLVNVKTEYSCYKVTDEHIYDSKALSELVNGVMKSNETVDKLFADGAYDGNNKSLSQNSIG